MSVSVSMSAFSPISGYVSMSKSILSFFRPRRTSSSRLLRSSVPRFLSKVPSCSPSLILWYITSSEILPDHKSLHQNKPANHQPLTRQSVSVRLSLYLCLSVRLTRWRSVLPVVLYPSLILLLFILLFLLGRKLLQKALLSTQAVDLVLFPNFNQPVDLVLYPISLEQLT